MGRDRRGFRTAAETGRPPTMREIAEHYGFRSPRAVSDHLAVLERKGWIERDAGSQLAQGATAAGQDVEDLEEGLWRDRTFRRELAREVFSIFYAASPVNAQENLTRPWLVTLTLLIQPPLQLARRRIRAERGGSPLALGQVVVEALGRVREVDPGLGR